ncbi:MAG TPA: hypothetical protein VFD43_06430 [Planctomycetota bacterium]|nr:hypothetical protein [Planctomycetota bacterium]
MKRRQQGPIAIVVADDRMRAAQASERGLVSASVELRDGLKKCLRQLLTSAPFVGRDIVLGLDGPSVLIESLVLPPGGAKDARRSCADRLKGDPLFSAEKAHLGVAVETMPATEGASPPALAIMAALNKERLAEVMKACHEIEVNVLAVEAATLATWRAWSGQGVQVRLVCSSTQAVLLAGQDSKLLFCRAIEMPIQVAELQATLARVATVLSCEGFQQITVAGLDESELARLAEELGLALVPPPSPVADAAAAGLATPGPILADFTPPEERVLREKRRVRKASAFIALGCAVLAAIVGMHGSQQAHAMEEHKRGLLAKLDMVGADKSALAEVNAALERYRENEAVIDHARPGHRMSTLFTLVTRCAGDGISFETVKVLDQPVEAPKSGQTTAGPRSRTLEIRMNGLARNGAAMRDFSESLLATGAFTDVRIEASERVLLGNGIEGERFRIYVRAETH